MSSSDERFHLLPYNRVVSAFESQVEVDAVLAALAEVNFSRDKIAVHHGEEGLNFIDPDGSKHGFLTQLIRAYERLDGSSEAKLLNQAEDALKAGHYVMSVWTGGSGAEQKTVQNIMKPHTDYYIFYCARFTIRILT